MILIGVCERLNIVSGVSQVNAVGGGVSTESLPESLILSLIHSKI